MKEIKTTKTIEEITGYEAFDGNRFSTKEECEKYEAGAVQAAKLAAWHYLVADRCDYEIFGSEDCGLYVFDIPDVKAYEIVLHWAQMDGAYALDKFTPDYIGKRVALRWSEWDSNDFIPVYATEEAMIAWYTERIRKMFADKEPKPQ